VEFWIAAFIVVAIIALTGIGGSLAAAPYSPEVTIEILNFTYRVVGLVVFVIIILIIYKYSNK